MTDKPQDWRTLDAGRDLDELVAERAGWTDLDSLVFAEEDNEHYAGMRPRKDLIPEYSTSVDAALSLIPRGVEATMIYFSPTSAEAEIGGEGIYGHSLPGTTTLALAICQAWLDWKERGSA